ncbi:MAG: hypothetical protein MR860_07770 [Prevotella sp.]|nr:hypothetical protein [Prevotella sp.]
MRKLLALLFLMLTITCQAQHMKFMGIPIDGTINQFTQKLSTKGIKVHPNNARDSGIANREFYGQFMNKQAIIWVWFNPKTKIVYEVKVVLYGKNGDETQKMYDKVSEVIKNKYNVQSTGTGELSDGTDSYYYIIQNDSEKIIGWVSLAREQDYDDWLSIFYTDAVNYKKNEASKYDDI